MDGRAVRDLMTRDVLVVSPDAPFKQVVQVLASRGVDAAPVVDGAGGLIGIVSASDLTCHEESRPSLVEQLVVRQARQRARKSRGRTARDLMSAPVQTVPPDAQVCDALALMNKAGVGRLVVVERGRIAGILTRSDLLRVYLRSDEELEQEVRAAVEAQVSCPNEVQVHVADGVARLQGWVERTSCAWAAAAAAAAVPGVVEVDDELSSTVDDTAIHEMSMRGPFL